MNLVLDVGGQRYELDPSRDYTIGRGSGSDIIISDPEASVSRHHLDVGFRDGAWLVKDRSSAGSFVNDQQFDVLELQAGMRIRLGQPGSPMVLVGSPAPAPTAVQPAAPPPPPPASPPPAAPPPASPPPAAPPPASPPPASPPPAVPPPAAPPPASPLSVPPPTPVLRDDAAVNPNATIILGDEALQLELDDRHHTFQPGQRVVVGRDGDCDVRSNDRLVSGKHCIFEHDGSSWTVEDLGSARGTFIDGRKVKKQKVAGVFTASLGDSNAGAQLRVVAKGTYKPKKDRGPLLLASLALAAVVIGGVALAVFWPDDSSDEQIAALQAQIDKQQQLTDDQIAEAQARADAAIAEANAAGGAGNSPSQLSAARLATAVIVVPDGNGDFIGSGSGALVSDDGLVLTNIHVVLPGLFAERTGEPGLANFNPEELIVGFPSTDGGPVDRFFTAEQVASHPAHDAALIRIVEGLDGVTLNDLPTPLPIGNSSELLAGDEIAIVGYPGGALTNRVSVSLTNFQSFQACVAQDVVCLRDYDEGWLNLAGETLTEGSSGGPIIHRGEVVGIQQGALITGSANDQELGVPINLVIEELDVG